MENVATLFCLMNAPFMALLDSWNVLSVGVQNRPKTADSSCKDTSFQALFRITAFYFGHQSDEPGGAEGEPEN